ncbi:hypothetical protein DCAR_0101923 [Daucus carota subsp. sativus]|uniref:Uncharacterized protein n=1 Tax=Daucus carota subsp. sativus TaxID=79200 RepID=A0AAF1AJT3_DAUCS|nr:hypothetical protein DCAR_0101923 [Daucus carota subsp. sativus]
MRDQMQQSNTAATAMYDYAGSATDAGDAVMARWLHYAWLQHLASPLATSAANDHRNMLMQIHLNSELNSQSAEEKQRLFKLMRHLNLNGEYGSEPYTPTAQNSGGVSEEQALYESLILLA